MKYDITKLYGVKGKLISDERQCLDLLETARVTATEDELRCILRRKPLKYNWMLVWRFLIMKCHFIKMQLICLKIERCLIFITYTL